jgi:hypothetical protein
VFKQGFEARKGMKTTERKLKALRPWRKKLCAPFLPQAGWREPRTLPKTTGFFTKVHE